MQRFKLARLIIAIMLIPMAAFAAVTLAEAAWAVYHCGAVAHAQAPPATAADSIYCRDVLFLGIDTAGVARVALGPLTHRDAAGNWLVLRYPYGMVCSAPALQAPKGQ